MRAGRPKASASSAGESPCWWRSQIACRIGKGTGLGMGTSVMRNPWMAVDRRIMPPPSARRKTVSEFAANNSVA